MDYKEKYEMALEGIQEILSSGEDSIKMSRLQLRLQGIFPELKESEDEKMRAMAIKAVHAPEAQSCIKSWGINPDDVIAWLEKQDNKPQGKTALEAAKEEKVDNQNCVKPANKVEPKDYSGIDPHFFKPAWSEEDKEMLEDTCRILSNSKECTTSNVRWLKSLKERYTWKPSKKQLEALESTTENCAYSEYQDCLLELIGQLKKLIC